MVVGNGRMATASVRALTHAGAEVLVAARRVEAAEELADEFDAGTLALDALEDELITADAAVFATAAAEPLLGPADFGRIVGARGGRPLAVVDLGLPRNVHPDTAALDGGKDGFDLFDLSRLDRDGYTVPGGHEAQIGAAQEVALIEAEVRGVVPLEAGRRRRRGDPGSRERRRRARGRRGRPDPRSRRAAACRGRAGDPSLGPQGRAYATVRTKEASARGDDLLLQAARWLFGIDGDDAGAEHAVRSEEASR